MEPLADVDFKITGKSLIKEVLDIVISTKYQEMKSSCHHDLENSEFMFIPIGKIVQQLFQDQKPMEYFNFLKFYENIIRNLNWVLQPRVNDKNKRICGVYNECNLCGQEIHPAIEFMHGTTVSYTHLTLPTSV